jgi:hypothetical protein
MQAGAALLQDLRRLIADDGFVVVIFFVVAAATVLAFGFGATSDVVASVLILGVMTALAESRLRTKK